MKHPIYWWLGKEMDNKVRWYDRHEQLVVLFDAVTDDVMPEDPEAWWTIVKQVWERTEGACFQTEAWYTIFNAHPDINSSTKEFIKNIPTLYRGITAETAKKDTGWSWTTDRNKAEWFAHRNALFTSGTPLVLECNPNPTDVLCYIEDSDEGEVILFNKNASYYVNCPSEWAEEMESV